jgi:sporulation and spore germination protein/immunoglobulin-like protein involved in spore germination
MNAPHPIRARVARLAAVALLVGACGPSSGIAGQIPSPQRSTDPSVIQSPDATAPPSASAPTESASVAPSTSVPAAPGSSASAGPTSSTSPSGNPSTKPSARPSPSASPAPTTVVRAYFLRTDLSGSDRGLVAVLRSVPQTKGVGRAATNVLLAGPTKEEKALQPAMTTAVPAGVTLLGISLASGVATVDLSSPFATGGSSVAQISRVAQVVYTLTQFSNVTAVKFQIEGRALSVPDGAGKIHSDAVGRAEYHERLPEIFVDRPAYGAGLGNPARIAGLSDVFEATFRVRISDGRGNVLADRQVMASCGSGCWGTFAVSIPYTVSTAQWGSLRTFNLSAKDGAVENIRDVPVWLTPAG